MASELPSPWRLAQEHTGFPGGPLGELLTFEGSLTEELTRLGDGDFHLQLTAQERFSEQAKDALLTHEDAECWLPGLCREVMMYVAGLAAVAARTLVPDTTAHAQGWLGELGGRSLGHALFERNDVRRSPFEFAPCTYQGDVVQRILSLSPQALAVQTSEQPTLWARRSRFQVGQHPLLVMEVFLPPAAALVQSTPTLGAAR
ncbi:MAG: chorismate lyase [Pseudomonadota bacterium]